MVNKDQYNEIKLRFCFSCNSMRRRLANWPAWSESDPHSSTEPVWPACRLKTSVVLESFWVE